MATNDFEQKKSFLYQGALLHNALIHKAPDDVLCRYLAFRIIVDTMSFEDMINNRVHTRIREIRNVLLAHKQDSNFFSGYNASDEICDSKISPLVSFMKGQITVAQQAPSIAELANVQTAQTFLSLSQAIMQKYYSDEVAGFRVSNNFLCFTGTYVHEVSQNELAGCFYRYNSSKALATFSQCFFNNFHTIPDYMNATRYAKRDIILHTMNMADCVFKDIRNNHSIDGLYDIMKKEKIGNPAVLTNLLNSQSYSDLYTKVRTVRNKVVGHMDSAASMSDLFAMLDGLSISDVYQLINDVDFAVHNAARTHMAIWARYVTSNSHVPEDRQFKILDIPGLKPTSYF